MTIMFSNMKDDISHNAFIFTFPKLLFLAYHHPSSYCLKHLCTYGTKWPMKNTLVSLPQKKDRNICGWNKKVINVKLARLNSLAKKILFYKIFAHHIPHKTEIYLVLGEFLVKKWNNLIKINFFSFLII